MLLVNTGAVIVVANAITHRTVPCVVLSGSSTYPIGETVENTYPCVVAGNRILVSAQYAYNPSGLRSAKTVGGSTKYFVYNGMNIVYEYEDRVSDGVVYCYGLNRTHNSDGEIYVYNAHGDTVQLVKDNAVVASYTYDAFGNLTSELCDNDNAFLYCSEYFDAETQTYYLRARYYNPANGRFTQQDAWAFMDTSDPLSLNLYTYCGNNPVMYVDPSGQNYLDNMKNSDGSYSLYDNKRFNPDTIFREQILSGTISPPSFSLEEGKAGLGSIEVDLFTGGWEYEYIDVSLMDFGHGALGAKIDENGVYMGAIASVWSPSFSVILFGIEIEFSAEVGSIGAELDIGRDGISIGAAAAFGVGISILF